MAADTNGSINGSTKAKPPKSSKALNGTKPVNGIKALSPSGTNSHVIKPTRKKVPSSSSRSRGIIALVFGLSARLLTWYAILTILFRCPATLDRCTEASPAMCVPYLQLKHMVVPHLEPYYKAYADPYVQAVQPYYEKVDRTVIVPTWGYAKKYGTPAVSRAQALGQAQWEKAVQPQLLKCQTLAKSKYDETLAPHVGRLSEAVGPYYDIARTNALQTYHEIILPAYGFLQPYAWRGYSAASAFTTQVAVPGAMRTWNITYAFLEGKVWPQLRLLYTETVEPQLKKIGNRLGRYNSNGPGQKATESLSSTISSKAASSFTKPTRSASSVAQSGASVISSLSSVASSVAAEISSTVSSIAHAGSSGTPSRQSDGSSSAGSKFSDNAEQVQAPEADADEEEKRRIARETVAEDLKAWQEKYTKAADDSAAEIQERVDEIAKKMVRREIRVRGKGLLEALQQSIVRELVQLRRGIITIIGSVQKGSATEPEAEEQVLALVRKAGLEIKQRAKDVRTWHEQFDNDVRTQVTAAADNHFQILGSIRDLALQKIGMKWAWTDGITYKDWAKYHLLKSRFDEWEHDLEKLVVSHPGLIECQNEGQAIEDRGMELASSAAKELARLKQVSLWKLAMLDDGTDFDTETTQVAFEAAEQAKAELEAAGHQGQDQVQEQEQEQEQSEAKLPGNGSSPAEEVIDDTLGTRAASEQPLASTALNSELPIMAANATETVEPGSLETGDSQETTNAEPVQLEAEKEQVDDKKADLHAEPLAPVDAAAQEAAKEATVEDDSTNVTQQSEQDVETDSTDSADFIEPASVRPSVETETLAAVRPAFLGAAAQSVPSRKPIMEDDTVESATSALKQAGADIPATISSVASSAYSVAMSRASEQYESALSMISANMQGTPLPYHEKLLSSVSEAYSRAAVGASQRMQEAVKSAESIYGAASSKVRPRQTQAPAVDWAAVESIAAERLRNGRAWAEEQYESAKVAIGLATPTPSSPAERLLQNAQHNYYAGLGVAHARYSEFMSAASSAFSSLTATPTPTDLAGTVSSAASVASESAVSVAGAAGEKAGAAYSAASAGAASVAGAVGENAEAAYSSASSAASVVGENVSSVADAAGSAISANWEALVSQISNRVYSAPTPTPWYDGLYSAAGEYAAAATDAAGEYAAAATDAMGVGGSSTTTGFAASASSASAEAAKQYAAVSALVSELLVGKEPTFSESIYSRLGAAYAAASATAAAAASDAADAAKHAGDKVGSVASEATEAVKSATERVRDEL